jgi:phosphoribosylamine--glycine ligase
MKVLVVGGGGREHALAWKLGQSPLVRKVFCAPGNAGIARHAECVDIAAADIHRLLDFARGHRVDLTVVGPEAPLTMGIVDLFQREGLPVFGASQGAALIEGSKAFAKELMKRYQIPTGYYRTFTDRAEAEAYAAEVGPPVVVKADGLAAGKGVVICQTVEEASRALREIMDERIFGSAGERVVVEEFLTGEEASFLAFTDGATVLPMASSQDHKTVWDDDRGPNTGGMGAYSPAPVVTDDLARRVTEEIMIPTVRAMAAEGRVYRGVLYAGLMISSSGARVLEFNARFGDPETQPVLMRMESDLVPILTSCLDGTLADRTLTWKEAASVCVVLASEGYPGAYPKGRPIHGLDEVRKMADVEVFHAGTQRRDGQVATAGGRVLGVTSLGPTVREAIDRAYQAVDRIRFEGMHHRRDIGRKALNRPRP